MISERDDKLLVNNRVTKKFYLRVALRRAKAGIKKESLADMVFARLFLSSFSVVLIAESGKMINFV